MPCMSASCEASPTSSSASSSTSYLTESLNVLLAAEENAFACQESVMSNGTFRDNESRFECQKLRSDRSTLRRLQTCKLASATSTLLRHPRFSNIPFHVLLPRSSTMPTITERSTTLIVNTLSTDSCTDSEGD